MENNSRIVITKPKDYLITFRPNERPEGYPEVAMEECNTADEAFLRSMELKALATDINIYKKVTLKIALE